MSDTNRRSPEFVSLGELARQLGLPVEWLANEARNARIPRLVVPGRYRRQIYRFNPRAVEECLAMRAALGDRPPAAAGEESS